MVFIMFIKVNVIVDAVLLAEKPNQKCSKQLLLCQNQNVALTALISTFSQEAACKWKIWGKICVFPC